ncbi:hypothetical protein CDAR_108771 [Caerostris darwini]|uniref:Uncharacterized protein n=1 Tax=Caerostris darwini TaxID=1538125 RepID=A0AAV4V786_9ARAC|nr:hypothetical protein CDAR_108771 [Caerostris darwini]
MAKVASTNGVTNARRVKADDSVVQGDPEVTLKPGYGRALELGQRVGQWFPPHKGDLESRLLNPLTRVRRTAASIRQAFFLVYFGNATTLFSQGTENTIISLLFKGNK